MCVMGIGLSVLAVIDAVIMLTPVMPKGAAFATTADLIVWAALYSVYLTAMALALYPGPLRSFRSARDPGGRVRA